MAEAQRQERWQTEQESLPMEREQEGKRAEQFLKVLLTVFLTLTAVFVATAQPKVTVKGTLAGYFLSTQGELKVYEVPFAFPEKPDEEDLPSHLYPLWAGYYLQAQVQSSQPIQSVWLLAGHGRLLWRRHYPERVKEASIPQQDGWVGVKGQDGLSVRLLVRFADGSEAVVRPHFAVRFERLLPLKVDWLDFVRIAEVANLLRERGKEIWEGFTLEGVPFLLEGDEGQWVLINHPKPPRGFVRYEGPLPKVPFRMTVYVGQKLAQEERWKEEAGGWLEKVNGVWTAALRYFPNWWVLEDYAPPGYSVTREPDAVYRLETIVHEAFHVWWFQRVKEPRTEGRAKQTQAVIAEVAERECLARALEAKEHGEKVRWAKAFVLQRERRRQQERANEAEVRFERWVETVEGVATFVNWKAIHAGAAEDYQPLAALEADNAFNGYRPLLGMEDVIRSLRGDGSLGRPHSLGLAQAFLLTEWRSGWQREALKGKYLEELLAEVVKGVKIEPKLLAEVEQAVNEEFQRALERTQERVKEQGGKPPEPHITVWIYLPTEIVQLVREMEKAFGNPLLAGICFPLPDITLQLQPPIWIEVDSKGSRVGVLWDAKKQLMVVHRPDGAVTLKGDGLEVQGKLQVTWDANGVHVRPANEAQKPKGGVSTMRRRKAWYAVVLPVALLAAIASRDTKAVQESETITMEGTITGVFLNAATDQFETVTLPVPSDAEDYYYADEEEYILQATFTPSWDPSNPTTQDFVVSVSVTYYLDPPRYMQWNFQLGPANVTIGGKTFKVKIEADQQGNIWMVIIDPGPPPQEVARFPLKKVPPPGELLVKVFLITENEQDPSKPTIAPFADVQVEARVWDKKKKEWKLKATVTTDGNGEALFPALAPGNYQLWGYKGRSIPACPRVTEEVTVVKQVRNVTSMYFYFHKPITGRVMEQTASGLVALPGARVYLFKGEQELSGPWESDTNGAFAIPPFVIDAILAQHGSGTYTIKVIPPSRSMMHPEPLEATKNVDLTKCERLKPLDTCPRALTVDVGQFSFTYKPAYPGPGGG